MWPDILIKLGLSVIIAAVAIGPNPACSVVMLAAFLAFHLVKKYFHDSFHDENKKGIAQIRIDLAKLQEAQAKADLKTAFGGGRG